MTEREKWEIDIMGLTLDDLEILAAGLRPDQDIGKLKAVMARMVTNKTEEEIGRVTLRELNDRLEEAMAEVEALAVPKQNTTAS